MVGQNEKGGGNHFAVEPVDGEGKGYSFFSFTIADRRGEERGGGREGDL